MLEEILELQRSLNLSQGELLDLARRITECDTLRTIDRLTASERARLIGELRIMKEYEFADLIA